MKATLLPVLLLALCLSACADNRNEEKTVSQDVALVGIDTTRLPADDFFEFVNGGWIKANAIPASETSWGIGHQVNEELYERKKFINTQALAAPNPSNTEKQISNFWKAAMDTVRTNQQGIKALHDELTHIDTLTARSGLQNVVAQLHRIGVNVFYTEGIYQDAKASDVVALYLYQDGLGMPNRDYYFLNDERTAKVREAYPTYITRLLTLSGLSADSAAAAAKAIVSLETSLAKNSRKLEDLRDPYANYNKYAWDNLTRLMPQGNLPGLLEAQGIPPVDSVIVGQPEFFTNLNKIWQQTPLPVLKNYMRFHLISEFAPYLGDTLSGVRFQFYGRTLKGAHEQRPYWKRVLDAEEEAIGEALGQLFAKEYFNETAKKRYEDLVESVRNAYRLRIEKLDWMSDSTKQKALIKLAAIKKKVGYPDKWKDFSTLKIDSLSFAGNMIRARAWWTDYYIAKIGKPVDRDEWSMTPQTYNAYYNPSNNEIVLPAGIFTIPGYRDEQLDDAIVYGYAGASTIGHEITHGFDDEGRQFDAEGNLKNWWSLQDEKEFNRRAALLVNQFNKMKVVDTHTINGKATLGENLADLGGILIGLDAFMQTETYKNNELKGGYTPLQRFFIGYAIGWRGHMRQNELASRLLTDVHSPAKQRVNGPMPNVPQFYQAFNVQPGNGMYLPDSLRVKLW